MVDLRNLLADEYLDKETIKAAAVTFAKSNPPNIQLKNILRQDKFNQFAEKLNALGWEKKYVPETGCYDHALIPLGLSDFLHSEEFKMLISFITHKTIHQTRAELCSFGHRDYTLLYDELRDSGIFFQLEFTSQWDQNWGGYTSFTQDEEMLRIVPSSNTLVLVDCKNMKHFTKYICHKAGQHKRILVEGLLK